jgi:hypothetical protein
MNEAVQTLGLSGDSDGLVTAIKIPQFDGRDDIKLRARRVIAEPHRIA